MRRSELLEYEGSPAWFLPERGVLEIRDRSDGEITLVRSDAVVIALDGAAAEFARMQGEPEMFGVPLSAIIRVEDKRSGRPTAARHRTSSPTGRTSTSRSTAAPASPVEMETECLVCGGTGHEPCGTCKGKGKAGGFLGIGCHPCEECGGTGNQTCPGCNGSGRVDPPRPSPAPRQAAASRARPSGGIHDELARQRKAAPKPRPISSPEDPRFAKLMTQAYELFQAGDFREEIAVVETTLGMTDSDLLRMDLAINIVIRITKNIHAGAPAPGTSDYEMCSKYLAMSLRAYDALAPPERAHFEQHNDVRGLRTVLAALERGEPIP